MDSWRYSWILKETAGTCSAVNMAFNRSATILISAVAAHPEWRAQPVPYGPADDPDALEGSVKLSLPVPHEAAHRLEVVLRGNTIEIAYDCGPACGPAERQFIFSDDEIEPAVAAVCDFVESLMRGQIVVVRERIGPVTRRLRRDDITELAWFRSAGEAKARDE